MSRSEALAARRKELRAAIARRRGSGDRRDRRWRWLLLLLLLVPFCLREPSSPEATPTPTVEPAMVPPPPGEVEPPAARVARRDRPAFEGATPEQLPWLAAFRLQVAARSTRLAECFVGASRPGALKWTASVEPRNGRVSDHVLEPTLSSDELSRPQRACVLGVLSEPPYRLDAEVSPSTPSRVGMVIEF